MAVSRTTMTSKGQVTVPRQIRDALGLHAGDHLVWATREDGVIEVRKAGARTLDDLVGLLGEPSRSLSLEEIDEALQTRFGRRAER